MKALSIQQPWAWAILYGGKDIENRKWPTRFRGRFIIHAGKRFDRDGFEDLRAMLGALKPPADVPLGAFLGTAEIVDCVRPEHMAVASNPWAAGPWCFILREIEPFDDPIPGKGSLGFFDALGALTGKDK